MQRYLLIILLMVTLSAAGCVQDPEVPTNSASTGKQARGVLIVNEGLWYQDNSTLSYHDPITGDVVQDYFRLNNPGLRLGDLGNDITISGNRAYIPVTTSQTVEAIELPSVRALGRLVLPPKSDPRHVEIVDDTTGFVSNVNDDAVVEFNPTSMEIRGRIPVGPAPEQLVYAGGRLFVTNSGYGDLRKDEPKAGTISVIDVLGGSESQTIDVGPNAREIVFSKSTGKLYVMYGLFDRPGGVVEIDLRTLRPQRHWEIQSTVAMAFDEVHGRLYVIASNDGVVQIDLNSSTTSPPLFVSSKEYGPLGFYSLGVSPDDGEVYIGFTRGYTVPAEVLVYDTEGRLLRRFPVGLNPGAFGFF
jgi:DNA-binding beta-propeller fold protein YncE